MLTPEFAALWIPIALLLAGAGAKKLVRATPFRLQDFYVGPEAALAAMATVLGGMSSNTTPTGGGVAALLAAVTLLMLVFILTTHQDWDLPERGWWGRLVWLGIVANLCGLSLLAASILWAKKSCGC